MTSPAIPGKPRRSTLVTLLGVAAILAGGLGSVFSAFALLMAIGKPYATSASDPLGILVIFILPPVTLLAGIGLLLRQRWARWWMILLMAALLALGAKGLLFPTPAFPMEAGEIADAVGRGPAVQWMALAAVAALVLAALLSRTVRADFTVKRTPPVLPASTTLTEETAGWRVGHRGRDMMYYEECHGGTWRRLDIDGEMLTGRAHHVIYFADETAWNRYPEWARLRRDEIIGRIKSRFREPDYEYHEASQSSAHAVVSPPFPAAPPAQHKPQGGVLPVILVLLALAAGSFRLASIGVENGETRLPAKYSSHTVTRTEDPALFWTAIATVSGVGLVCAGSAAWLARAALRRR